MRIYVAGKWQEKAQVRKVQAAMVEAGHEITFDWTQDNLGQPEKGGDDWVQIYNLWYDPMGLAIQADNDLQGVKTADVIVICAMNPHKYSGTLCEMGIALGCGHDVYIIGNNLDSNIFTWLLWVRVVGSVEEVLDALR